MEHRYTADFKVHSYEVDAWGELSTQMLAAYMEQTAWEASDAAGFGNAWYTEQNAAWVIHRLTLARLGRIAYMDAVTVESWISSIGRVRLSREYMVRGPDGEPIAAGRADWVYMDRVKLVPKGIDRKITETFQTMAPNPLLVPPAVEPAAAQGRLFTATRRTRRYEADSMGHTNNTVYLAWLDEARDDALDEAGLPLAPPGKPGLRLRGVWYVVEYARSAMPGDELEIAVRFSGTIDGEQLECRQEITRAGDETPLVRCTSRQQVLGLEQSSATAGDLVGALV
ncbi:MAG: acyl-[acyl-carrier-protein] thioesterase [Chloroflexia bacterium]